MRKRKNMEPESGLEIETYDLVGRWGFIVERARTRIRSGIGIEAPYDETLTLIESRINGDIHAGWCRHMIANRMQQQINRIFRSYNGYLSPMWIGVGDAVAADRIGMISPCGHRCPEGGSQTTDREPGGRSG